MSTTTLSCRQLGDKQCDFVATGKDRDEVKRNMLEHAAREHFRKEEAGAERNDGGKQRDALSQLIDETLDDRAGAPREDASQGGEFLDDDQIDENDIASREEAEGGAGALDDARGRSRDKARAEGGGMESGGGRPGEGRGGDAANRRDGDRVPLDAEEGLEGGVRAHEGRRP